MEINQTTIQQMIDKSINDYAFKAMFGVAKVPAHTHNGVDSSRINAVDIIGLSTGTGLSTATGILTKGAGGGTGNESVVCDFQPTMIQFFTYPSGNNNTWSLGTQTADGTNTLLKYISGGNNVVASDTSYVAVIWNDALTLNTELEFVSFNTNGFTVNWYTDDVSTICKWIAYA